MYAYENRWDDFARDADEIHDYAELQIWILQAQKGKEEAITIIMSWGNVFTGLVACLIVQ